MQFFLWSGRTPDEEDQATAPIGNCFIEMNKIYLEMINFVNLTISLIIINNTTYTQDRKGQNKSSKFAYRKEISVSEKLWNNGACIGTVLNSQPNLCVNGFVCFFSSL